MIHLRFLFLPALLIFTFAFVAQGALRAAYSGGLLQTEFAPVVEPGGGLIRTMLTLPDGKLMVGGDFYFVGGRRAACLARINRDGTVDTTFEFSAGADGPIHSIARQPDGRILIGGDFKSIAGYQRHYLARLLPDGTLDASFDPGDFIVSQGAFPVRTIGLQSDGKIVIGGYFTGREGQGVRYLARLHPDGSWDSAFAAEGYPGAGVLCIRVDAQDRIVAAGSFQQIAGRSARGLMRLTADGRADPDFDLEWSLAVGFHDLVLHEDGKITAVTGPMAFGGPADEKVVRFNTDGSRDRTFSVAFNAPPTTANFVESISPTSEGRLLVVGAISDVNGVPVNRMAVLNTDGSLDATFRPAQGPDAAVSLVVSLDGGRFAIGGPFSSVSGVPGRFLAVIEESGNVDARFAGLLGDDSRVEAAAVDGAGNILIAGKFSSVNGQPRANLARLNSDGSLDHSFYPGAGAELPTVHTAVKVLAVQPDSKILIGGPIVSVNGHPRSGLARLHADGTLDETFLPGSGFAFTSIMGVRVLLIQPDGKILVGGEFSSLNDTPVNNLVRLHPDGSLDATFVPGSGPGPEGFFGHVSAIALQSDGKILVGGWFTSFSGVPRPNIARLHSNGSVDSTFHVPLLPAQGLARIYAITVQTDGRILIGGNFTRVDGVHRRGIARLMPDGTIDEGFSTGSGPVNPSGQAMLVARIELLAEGRIALWGDFSEIDGRPASGIARLHADGGVDDEFFTLGATRHRIHSGAVMPDGSLLIAGKFWQAEGQFRTHLARYHSPVEPYLALARHPLGAMLPAGAEIRLSVDARGTPEAITYQWSKDDVPIVGATSATLYMKDFKSSDAGLFTVEVSNGAHSAHSRPARLDYIGPPEILPSGPLTGEAGFKFEHQIATAFPATAFYAPDLPADLRIDATSGLIAGTPLSAEASAITVTALNPAGSSTAILSLEIGERPRITKQPAGAAARAGENILLEVEAAGSGTLRYAWLKEGEPIGATEPSLLISPLTPAAAGTYSVIVSNAIGSAASLPAIVGIVAAQSVEGSGYSPAAYQNIQHPNGKIFDQVLLSGSAVTVRADPGQITRISYLDLHEDIVQVEFSGSGQLTLTLEGESGPIPPARYNQDDVEYMKGLASIVVTEADASTHVAVFSLGPITALMPGLIRDDIVYDGWADLARVSITSVDGEIAGLRFANVHFSSASGMTGIYAPDVAVASPVLIGEITAFDAATPVLIFGSAEEVRIAGGNLAQENGRAVATGGVAKLTMTAGTTSGGVFLPPQVFQGKLESGGQDVTQQIVAP